MLLACRLIIPVDFQCYPSDMKNIIIYCDSICGITLTSIFHYLYITSGEHFLVTFFLVKNTQTESICEYWMKVGNCFLYSFSGSYFLSNCHTEYFLKLMIMLCRTCCIMHESREQSFSFFFCGQMYAAGDP